MRFARASVLLAILFVVPLSASTCRRNAPTETPRPRQVFLSASGLLPLTTAEGFYELWLGVPAQAPPAGTAGWAVPQSYTAIGAFRVDTLDVVLDLRGAPLSTLPLPDSFDAGALARGLVTYQTPADLNALSAPGFKLAAGSFTAPGYIQGTDLVAEDPEVAPFDLSTITGEVTLATPTTANPNDEYLGAWFFRGDVSAPEQSITFGAPGTLPDTLRFEGWLLERSEQGAILTHRPMGRFRNGAGLDSDGAGPNAGTEPPPPFPGEDFDTALPTGIIFLRNPEVMVTLEPEPDPAPQLPSSLRVLRLGIELNAPRHEALAMANGADSGLLPRVTLTVQH